MKVVVCSEEELERGSMRPAPVTGRPIVVIRSMSGELYALADRCPHQGARLSLGYLGGAPAPGFAAPCVTRDGEIVRCPWHNYSFDAVTGRSLHQPERYRVKTYPVWVEDGDVVVETG